MASSRRTLVLFLVLSFAHLLLMSVQVQARSGLPLIQAAAFSLFAAVQHGTSAVADTGQSLFSNYVALRGVAAENDALKKRILEIDAQGDVANCAVTEYVLGPGDGAKDGSLVLKAYNRTLPLKAQGTPVTTAPDAKVAAR